jgi:hypothetical protein
MRRRILVTWSVPFLICMAAISSQWSQEEIPAGSSSRFVSYPTFRPRFHNQSETFTLIANFYLVNAAAQSLTNVTFHQTFPQELKPALAPQELQEQLSYPPEFTQKIEGGVYTMFLPKLVRRQAAVILSELSLERRMSTFTVPPTQIEFTLSDAPGKEETLPVQLDVTEYANHVGNLERFLRKKARIGLDITVTGRDNWEFAPPDAVATGRNPAGVIGVETRDDGYSGNFRIHNGAPGNALDVLVVWKSTSKNERIQDEKSARSTLSEFLKWTGPFRFDPDDSKITQSKFKKYEAWILEGRWVDSIPKHLGSGPAKALVFYSPREDVEYAIVLTGQGRGAGPDKCDTPAPDKEKALLTDLGKILDTFKSDIVPVSTR